ncbi:uncharacterized protein LOC124373718 [Homalodisca vitripennis]|uniref:uncharacterized protein LOC124373718 n=1 Tax=Homalodisca vitripennis TaxID=197043 RepID=UPI001EEA263F|nr:uncharacterized protein LOC124373718 [Homalodisca vitripennis]
MKEIFARRRQESCGLVRQGKDCPTAGGLSDGNTVQECNSQGSEPIVCCEPSLKQHTDVGAKTRLRARKWLKKNSIRMSALCNITTTFYIVLLISPHPPSHKTQQTRGMLFIGKHVPGIS